MMIKISDKHKHFWGEKIPTKKDLQSYCEELNLDFDYITKRECEYLKISEKELFLNHWHSFIHEMAHHYVDGFGYTTLNGKIVSRSHFKKPWCKDYIFAFEEDVRLWAVIFAKSKQLINPLDRIDFYALAEVKQWRDIYDRRVFELFDKYKISVNNYQIPFVI